MPIGARCRYYHCDSRDGAVLIKRYSSLPLDWGVAFDLKRSRVSLKVSESLMKEVG